MGNRSSKSSFFCCPCVLTKSYPSSSSLSIDEKSLPTFDHLVSHEKSPLPANPSSIINRRSISLHDVILPVLESKPPLPPGKSKLPRRSFRSSKRTYYSQSIEHARVSIEDLEKSLQGAASIDQWIDSLPTLGTPLLSRNQSNLPLRTVASAKIKRSFTLDDDHLQRNESPIEIETPPLTTDLPKFFHSKFNRDYFSFAKDIHLNFYVNDFLTRLKHSKVKQTFKEHFAFTPIIYTNQSLADDLTLCLFTPSESLLPSFFSNLHSNSKLHEQIRSKSYFIPSTFGLIDVHDEDYQDQLKEFDRTHVVITLETKTKDEPLKRPLIEQQLTGLFVSKDSFQTGRIEIDRKKLSKYFLPFVFHSIEENRSYLSSTLIQQWFQTLMLVNQTSAIAKRFLKGDGTHLTCLLKQSYAMNSSHQTNSLTFAALRLPPCLDGNELVEQEEFDGFSPIFLSDLKKISTDTIHIDSEQYSFAFYLSRWPKSLLEHFQNRTFRQWPSNSQMNILIKKPLLLIPIDSDHQWEIHFDSIEQCLFEWINESTLVFYALCQQIFSHNFQTRTVIKHCFLNYCEKYGQPFSS